MPTLQNAMFPKPDLEFSMLEALFIVALFVASDDKKSAPLTGIWIVETAEMGGKPMTEHLKGLRYTVGDGKYTAKLGERTETGAYKLDDTKMPREMDTTPADGPLKDKTLLAIVEVDGDTLRVCYDRDGKERPKKFETPADKPSVILMVFKREKSETDGTWVIEKAELDGADATALLKQFVLTLEKGTYTLDDKGRKDEGTIKLDASKSPKQMDIISGEKSPFKGKTFPCIYEMKDGKLTVCYGMDYKTRPTEFKTAKDSNRMLAVYKKK